MQRYIKSNNYHSSKREQRKRTKETREKRCFCQPEKGEGQGFARENTLFAERSGEKRKIFSKQTAKPPDLDVPPTEATFAGFCLGGIIIYKNKSIAKI